jgi:site-specific recombinase XerD
MEWKEKFISAIRVRGLASDTVHSYLAYIEKFIKFNGGKNPSELGLDEVLKFQIWLVENKFVNSSVNGHMAALKFLYRNCLNQDWPQGSIPHMKKQKRVPVILSPEEVAKIFNEVDHLKHRTILMLLYSSGLRINEAVHLHPKDIDSQRMLIHVRFGKGSRERYTLLSPRLLHLLRLYWVECKEDKTYWLFPGKPPTEPCCQSTTRVAFRKAKKRAGITKNVCLHSLRHAFATHLMEAGTDIRLIQLLLGHTQISSTLLYTQLRTQKVPEIKNPLDSISSKIKWL